MQNNEHLEQVLLIQWFRAQYPLYANCLWAIPNGGIRHIKTAIRLKREGALSGVSDLFLMIPKGNFHGAFIEMKAKKGKIQENQLKFIKLAKTMGYEGVICYGFQEAKEFIQNYLNS